MSDIKAGDLVMVVRGMPCCGEPHRIGASFRVLDVVEAFIICAYCGHASTTLCADEVPGDGPLVSRLIRIDPPEQPESVETDREVMA